MTPNKPTRIGYGGLVTGAVLAWALLFASGMASAGNPSLSMGMNIVIAGVVLFSLYKVARSQTKSGLTLKETWKYWLIVVLLVLLAVWLAF